MNRPCTLFNYTWSGSDREFGHIVFRGPYQRVDEYGYTVNKVAIFVLEDEAADYCVYRNQKTAENGSDRLENGT